MSPRRKNLRQIIRLIHMFGPISRQEISKQLDISFANACNLVNELEDSGLCYLVLDDAPSKSRPQQLLNMYPRARVGLVMDFTTNEISVSLSDLFNNDVDCRTFQVSQSDSLRTIIYMVKESANDLLEKNAITKEDLMGGIAVVPGITSLENDTVLCASHQWLEGVPLNRILEEALECPVWVENDANAGAVALSRSNELCQHLVFVYIGIGLGLGIVNDGTLVTGVSGFAGEIGHMPLGDPEVQCTCGERGCLEATFSPESLRQAGQDPERFKRTVEALSTVVSLLANLLDPQLIVIGCDDPKTIQEMLPHVQAQMSRRVVRDNLRTSVKVAVNAHSLFFTGASEVLFQNWLETFELEGSVKN